MAETLSLALGLLLVTTAILPFSAAGASSTRLKLANECSYTIWPGVVSGRGTPPLSTTTTSFTLEPGESASIFIPAGPWSGQIWARTLCSYDYTGRFTCLTGDCGTGSAECASAQTVPPVTVAKFNMSGNGGLGLYVVSSSLGYNLGILVVPHGGRGGDCMATGCVNDVQGGCESETRDACNRTCFAFGVLKYCCSGAAHTRPESCKLSPYSLYLKSRCPYVFDYYMYADTRNNTRRFACISADYAITFCPHPSSVKSLTKAVSRPSGATKIKRVIVIVAVVVTTVTTILLIVFNILSPGLAISIASAAYTALALLYAL
ncbi:hypothetical protein RJ639_020514 [Escallonia herrerae]|uniref:Thaumatin-like protein n=1 Tax=Escallonia herrerae TaxID=1293975 RepID=A0AA88V4R1_9ASTE|nr:hypothetical protein RJ639_020514 [Escallonia herrerae]